MLTKAKPDKPHALLKRPKALILTDLVWEAIQEPPPVGKRRANTGEKVAAMLDAMAIGSALRVNRREDTIRSRITQYRQLPGNALKRFIIRQETQRFPYWSRVWRVSDRIDSSVKQYGAIQAETLNQE